MVNKILLVDDDPLVLRAHHRHLRDDFNIDLCESPFDALEKVRTQGPYAVVVSDYMMPGMTGFELLRRIRAIAPDTVRIVLTGSPDFYAAVNAVNDGRVFRFLAKPCSPTAVRMSLKAGLEEYQFVFDRRNHTKHLEATVRQQTLEIREAHEETIHCLLSASTCRDGETGAHIRRVGLFSHALALAAGWSDTDAERLKLSAPMHDVGKIGIPDAILRKPGKLSPAEWQQMKAHTTIGAEMLAGSTTPVLVLAHEIALSHHERWDGSGYPLGLAGESIPESARIVSIADVYDALSTHRVYRDAFPEAIVLKMLREGRGTHHDPRLLDLFFAIYDQIRTISEENPDIEGGVAAVKSRTPLQRPVECV